MTDTTRNDPAAAPVGSGKRIRIQYLDRSGDVIATHDTHDQWEPDEIREWEKWLNDDAVEHPGAPGPGYDQFALVPYLTPTCAATIEELLPLLDDEWYEAVEGCYSDLPTWGSETQSVREQINYSCGDGDIVSWDTRDPDARKHLYLRRTTDPAHVHGDQDQEFFLVSATEYDEERA